MKKIFYLFAVLNIICALNLNFELNNSEIFNQKYNGETRFHSLYLVHNETPKMNKALSFEVSCTQMNLQLNSSLQHIFSFHSFCNEVSDCPHYITKQSHTHVSLAPRKICPLNGTLTKATLFKTITKNNLMQLHEMVIVIYGCNYVNENGIIVETLWILSEGVLSENRFTFNLNEFYYYSPIVVADDVYFDYFNRDCSKLCDNYCSKTKFEEFMISIETFIYGVLILFAIIGCIFCMLASYYI